MAASANLPRSLKFVVGGALLATPLAACDDKATEEPPTVNEGPEPEKEPEPEPKPPTANPGPDEDGEPVPEPPVDPPDDPPGDDAIPEIEQPRVNTNYEQVVPPKIEPRPLKNPRTNTRNVPEPADDKP